MSQPTRSTSGTLEGIWRAYIETFPKSLSSGPTEAQSSAVCKQISVLPV